MCKSYGRSNRIGLLVFHMNRYNENKTEKEEVVIEEGDFLNLNQTTNYSFFRVEYVIV